MSLFCYAVLLVLQSFRCGKERADCCTFIAFLMSCGCYWSLPLPHTSQWLDLQRAIVSLPGHTHLIFMKEDYSSTMIANGVEIKRNVSDC